MCIVIAMEPLSSCIYTRKLHVSKIWCVLIFIYIPYSLKQKKCQVGNARHTEIIVCNKQMKLLN
jgi:hypothetical protein